MTFADLGITPGHTEITVEAGNCNASLSWAIQAVDAAADTGARFFKAQFYTRENLTTQTAPTYGHKGIREPATQWEHFHQRLAPQDWQAVAWRCRDRNLIFFASVFDEEQLGFAENMGMQLYKIASADITHKPLIQAVAATRKPIILSTGAATIDEIGRAFTWIKDVNSSAEVLPLICTLSYPCPPNQAHLARLSWWIENVGPMVGYSDHTEGISAMCTAQALGAVMIEKHFTVTPGAGGDHDFAATPDDLFAFAAFPTHVEGPNHKVEMGSSELGPRVCEYAALRNARRSIAAARTMLPGHVIRAEDLTFLRPGTGAYEPWQIGEVVGCRVRQRVGKGELLPLLGGEVVEGKGRVSANLTVE